MFCLCTKTSAGIRAFGLFTSPRYVEKTWGEKKRQIKYSICVCCVANKLLSFIPKKINEKSKKINLVSGFSPTRPYLQGKDGSERTLGTRL